MFWQFWQWAPAVRLIFRGGGARRRAGPRECGIPVPAKSPHGGFGLYRPPPPTRAKSNPISLTCFDVKGALRIALYMSQLGG